MFADEMRHALQRGHMDSVAPGHARTLSALESITALRQTVTSAMMDQTPRAEGYERARSLMRDLIASSSVYVFEPSAVDTITALSASRVLSAQQPYLHLPARLVWLEWCGVQEELFGPHHDRRGLLFWPDPDDDDSWADDRTPERGCVTIFQRDVQRTDTGGNRIVITTLGFDLRRPDGIVYRIHNSRTLGADATVDEQVAAIGRWVAAALILRNTPRVLDVRPSDLTRLNRARVRGGKTPLLPYSQIYVPIIAAAARRAGVAGGGEATDCASRRRRRHEVDAFFRIRLGQVEMVRRHERGDESLGRVKTLRHLR